MLKKDQLHGYQVYSADHIMENTHCGLFLDMGLGKTISTLTAIESLIYEELDISNALIVAPKRVAEKVWSDEVEKWEHVRHLKISKIIGNQKARISAIKTKADIYIISRDNIAWLCSYFGGTSLPYDMLVLDELSSFKNYKSVRFKALRKVQPSFHRIVGLTGTPAPNGLIDLWSQIWLMDRGERLGKTVSEYRTKYFTAGARNGHIVFNYKLQKNSEEIIYHKIGDICVSMKSEDYLKDLELPEHNPIWLSFPPKLRKQYDDFERDQVMTLIQETGDKEVSALNAAALSNKLLQFSNGAIYGEDLRDQGIPREVHHLHDIKLDACEELIEESNGKPVLIAWSFRHDRDRLMERLKKYKPRELTDNQAQDDWNAGKIQVLLTHPASGGHGLNLQFGGNTLIWFGQNWSLELYQQLNKRLNRQGQKDVVTIHHILIEGTMDDNVMEALENKTAKQEGLMQAVKARIKKYAETR